MEIELKRLSDEKAQVLANGQASHRFAFAELLLAEAEGEIPERLREPENYGRALYDALFPAGSLARTLLEERPGRLLLVSSDEALQGIPWEYAYGPEGFLALDCNFVRGLPAGQRQDTPALAGEVRIVAIPSNPLHPNLAPLNIEGEWQRLREIIDDSKQAITLERARPPSFEQLLALSAGRQQLIVHFMGHGSALEGQARLLLEKPSGELDPVAASDFVRSVRGKTFLASLNACVSARPGPTTFSNLALALVERGLPYALDMRYNVFDDDARTLSRVFYRSLAQGTPVETALTETRLALSRGRRPWVVGVPVLYTSLKEAAGAFQAAAGHPRIDEYRPPMEVNALPRAEGTFQGRVKELVAIGRQLTGDERPRLLTIHGAGGQGKTALAREAVEGFAFAFPGGVWAASLENLPTRAAFVTALARFLGVATAEIADPAEIERQLHLRLEQQRRLLVLDNAETLLAAVERGQPEALALARFIRQELNRPLVSLLATSRQHLGWPGEAAWDLGGLADHDGALLFRDNAPQKGSEIELAEAVRLSQQVGGHPLSLQLLGRAFNDSPLSLAAFSAGYERELAEAQDKYREEDHRHRTLFACMDISVRALPEETKQLLSGLWLFHSPFLPETAVEIFDPDGEYEETEASPVLDHLHSLWQRGLLLRETTTLADGTLLLYRLLPALRFYVEKYLAPAEAPAELLARFGGAYADLAWFIHDNLSRGGIAVVLAQQSRADLERGLAHVEGEKQVRYQLHLGWVWQRLGDSRWGILLTEQALEAVQGCYQHLEPAAMNNLAMAYRATGRPKEALQLYQQALSITRGVGDRAGEATTLNNMANVYQGTGQPQEALKLHQQSLTITRELGDRAGEATTLTNMAVIHRAIGNPQEALRLYQQALPIRREVGDRAGEAATLNNMAGVYQATGQPLEALAIFQEALSIRREVGDRAGEATTLNNMAGIYDAIGQPQKALRLYQDAVSIRREVGDRAGEAVTLNNIAAVQQATGRLQEALQVLKQALLIRREVGDRAGEATTLNNMAVVYQGIGQPQEALELSKQALSILRQVSNRGGEAATLSNMAYIYNRIGKPRKALQLYRQALPIMRDVGNRAGEATTLNNIAAIYQANGQLRNAVQFYQRALQIMRAIGDRAGEATALDNLATTLWRLEQYREAISHKEAAVTVLEASGLSFDGSGTPRSQVEAELAAMRRGEEPGSDESAKATEREPAVPADFVARSVQGLMGDVRAKLAATEYLQSLPGDDPDLQALAQTVQRALFEKEPAGLEHDLKGAYAQAWQQILDEMAG